MGKLGEVGTDDEFLKQTISPKNIQNNIRHIMKSDPDTEMKARATSSHKKSVSQTTTGAAEKASMNDQNIDLEETVQDPIGVIQPIIRKEKKDNSGSKQE